MARRIVITSGKGGVGKTTCSYLLGVNLARLGARVVILDVDIGLNNLDVVAGVDTRVNFDLIDVIGGRCRIKQALIRCEKYPLLCFLPCVNSFNIGQISDAALGEVLMELNNSFDYILIDCPAGIGFEFHRAVFCANEAIVVTTPHLIAIRDAGKVANLLTGYTLGSVGLLVNRVRMEHLSKSAMISPADIAKSLQLPLVGTIRESEQITALSSTTGELLTLNDGAMEDFAKLATAVHHNQTAKRRPQNFFDIKIKRSGN